MGKAAKFEEVALERLIPYVNNAKQHTEEQVAQIAASIREFGFVSPCLIDADYNLIAGHGRVMAARVLELQAVPCVFIEGLSEAQRKAYILADNRLAELAAWDMTIVAQELAALEEMGFDTDLTGFEIDEIEEDPLDVEEDDYEEEPPENPQSEPGGVYRLGQHRLICGDATDPETIGILMDGETADLFLTDPPYNIDYTGGSKLRERIENDN